MFCMIRVLFKITIGKAGIDKHGSASLFTENMFRICFNRQILQELRLFLHRRMDSVKKIGQKYKFLLD